MGHGLWFASCQGWGTPSVFPGGFSNSNSQTNIPLGISQGSPGHPHLGQQGFLSHAHQGAQGPRSLADTPSFPFSDTGEQHPGTGPQEKGLNVQDPAQDSQPTCLPARIREIVTRNFSQPENPGTIPFPPPPPQTLLASHLFSHPPPQ